MFTIRNAYTKQVYSAAPTLRLARAYCDQRLLRCAYDRQRILSDLAAGLIEVCEAQHVAHNDVFNPGF